MDQVPLSLYLKLEQGERADLTVVSRAAIEFTRVIEEMAGELFPGSLVRVEALNATDASFGWNTIVKIYENAKAGILAGAGKHPKAAWLAAYVALRILNNAIDWSQDQVMDWLAGNDAPAEVRQLSDSERRDLARDIATELRKGTAEAPADAMFRELRKDAKIEGAGVTVLAGRRPKDIVSKEHFVTQREAVEEGSRRVVTRRLETTLVSPVLMMGDRRWKFRSATGEFGAPIRDQAFLADVLSGAIDIRLRAGLVLDIDLETTEAVQDGAWTIEQRAVVEIHGWRNAPEQPDLLASASDIEPDEDTDEDPDGEQEPGELA